MPGKQARGANRVVSGWDDNLKDADRKEDSEETTLLMDEKDTTNFKCNIPYLDLSYERSASVDFDVTGGGVRCGAVMDDGQKVVYDFFVEARLAWTVREEAKLANATEGALWIFLPNGDQALRIADARVKFHAYGKTKKDIDKIQRWDPATTAENLSERHFKSGGYKAEVELYVKADGYPRALIAAYEMTNQEMQDVTLSSITVEFTGPAHNMAPRVSKAYATLEIGFTTKHVIQVKGSGSLPYPIAGDRPLVANVDVAFVGVSPTGGEVSFKNATLIIYPNAQGGGVYGTLHAVTAPLELTKDRGMERMTATILMRALSMDLRTEANGVNSAGMWSILNRTTAVTTSAAFGYADAVAVSGSSMMTGDAFVYTPVSSPSVDGSPRLVVNLTSVTNKAEGCRNVIGGLFMTLGAINPGKQGGWGRLPNPLVAPVWGTVDCDKKVGDPKLVISGVTAQYAPLPDDPNFILYDLVIKANVTAVPDPEAGLGQEAVGTNETSLDLGNLAGTIHAALDVASSASSVLSLPPLGGWATVALNFWATKGDLMGFQTSSYSVHGVLDSRLGDPDRPYARIVAPVQAELPCFGVLETVGSIFANIDGVFRLHAENVPMNLSCGDGGDDADDERVPDLVASADLTLVLEPPEEFNKLVKGVQAKANEMINAARDVLRSQTGIGTTNAASAAREASAASAPPASGDSATIMRAATQLSEMEDNPLKYDGRFTIPFLKTINIKARHLRGRAWLSRYSLMHSAYTQSRV